MLVENGVGWLLLLFLTKLDLGLLILVVVVVVLLLLMKLGFDSTGFLERGRLL